VKEELTIPKALVEPEAYNIKDKMEDILSLLGRSRGKLLFSEAFHFGSRSELVVTFLALLELIKLRTGHNQAAANLCRNLYLYPGGGTGNRCLIRK
jgi:hypothetical protein